MGLALVFAIGVLFAGLLLTRCGGEVRLGLAPPLGLGLLTIVATWLGVFHVPAPVPGLALVALVVAGLTLAVSRRALILGDLRAVFDKQPLAAAVLIAALLVPLVAMGIAFAQVQAPLSPHDGAFHVETSDAFRQGTAVSDWYPPGLAALFGAVLQVVFWIDTAAGGAWLGMGLTLVAPVAVFGLGVAVFRNATAASVGALLVSLTHLFLYYPQIWSGWPQLLGLLLVLGLWIVAIEYASAPSWEWALLAGLLLGAIVMVHGTELYTSAIVLVVVAVANWRRLEVTRLLPHALLSAGFGVVLAAPYLPVLLHWAGGGGAYSVGYENGTALEQGTTSALGLLAAFVADALGVDLPIRIVLLALGLMWIFRCRRGTSLVAVAAVFTAFAVAATLLNGVGLVRDVFAVTFPWSLPYRHLTFASVPLGLIAGGGWLLVGKWWGRALARVRGVTAHRRLFRLGRLLVGTWLVLCVWALTTLLAIEAGGDVSFTSDDAAAMAWLRANVGPGQIVVNDTFADAGIWAPYKAGVQILIHRSGDDPATSEERALIVSDVAHLDQMPEAAAAACALHASYVYYGAANAAWQVRTFPPVADMQRSPALREVFVSGKAHVFRIALPC